MRSFNPLPREREGESTPIPVHRRASTFQSAPPQTRGRKLTSQVRQWRQRFQSAPPQTRGRKTDVGRLSRSPGFQSAPPQTRGRKFVRNELPLLLRFNPLPRKREGESLSPQLVAAATGRTYYREPGGVCRFLIGDGHSLCAQPIDVISLRRIADPTGFRCHSGFATTWAPQAINGPSKSIRRSWP